MDDIAKSKISNRNFLKVSGGASPAWAATGKSQSQMALSLED